MADDEVGIRIKIKEAAKAISEIGAVRTAIAGVGTTANKSTKELASMSSQGLSTFSGIANSVKTASRNIAQYSAYAVVAGAAGVGFGLKTAGSLEQTNVAFKRMLGSQELATKKIKELQAFAISSPYDFQTIIGNARTLIAKGFDPGNIVETMKTIGDAVASVADPSQSKEAFANISYVLGQINHDDYALNTKDIYQFQNANVNALKYLTEASGKSVTEMNDLIQKKAVKGSDATRVILAGMKRDYGGMMDAQNKTMLGQISAVSDAIKAGLYSIDEQGRVTGTLGPLVTMIERDLPHAAILATKAMSWLGKGVKSVTDGISDLAWFYKMGGIEGLLGRLEDYLPFGINLIQVWRHLKTDTKNLADVWRNSLWPAIKVVSFLLAPLVYGTLKVLEGTLRWMADHPNAAAAIFTLLGAALAEWAIIATLTKIVGTISLVTTGFKAANAAVKGFALASAAVGATEAIPGVKTGYGHPNVAPVAAKAGWLSRAGNAVLGVAENIKAGIPLDYILKDDGGATSTSGMTERLTKGHKAGGTMSMSGWTPINEDGDELVKLPGGAKVTKNKDFASMLKQVSKGTTVIFGEGSLQVSGFDYNQPKKFADIVIQEVQTRIARG